MKKCILTFPAIAIALLTVLIVVMWPKSPSDQKKTSTEFVSLKAEMPKKRERVRTEKQDDEGPVMIHVSGLKAQLESRQDLVEEGTTDSLNK
jgi:hypothetical protein